MGSSQEARTPRSAAASHGSAGRLTAAAAAISEETRQLNRGFQCMRSLKVSRPGARGAVSPRKSASASTRKAPSAAEVSRRIFWQAEAQIEERSCSELRS
ncbi:MAG: hypothetical protein M0D55_08965 [Elusimicrobiota bacterium]|nr:MAG: hypothetical protein M0D55_08965 [Elusimicrobiota bacterium]